MSKLAAKRNLNIPPSSTVTLPLGSPSTGLWMPDPESRYIYVLIFILCIIKFDLFSAKQLQDPAEFYSSGWKRLTPRQTNEMILGGLAAA